MQDTKATPRTVLITGASTGIGEACALYLDNLGFTVFAGVRKEEDGKRLEEKASKRLTPVTLDVTSKDQIAQAAKSIAEAVGGTGLQGLVNNAGVAITGPLEFIQIDELRRQLEINVIGQIAVAQAVMALLRQGQGRVVNMGSIAGRIALPLMGPYAASKFALEALTDSMRLELAPWGIHVSIIEPGVITTPIWEKSRRTTRGMIQALPRDGRKLYFRAIAAMGKAVEKAETRGIPVGEVARAVTHALTARRPKTRYVVGRHARLQAKLIRFIPDRIRDRFIVKDLKLPTEASKSDPQD